MPIVCELFCTTICLQTVIYISGRGSQKKFIDLHVASSPRVALTDLYQLPNSKTTEPHVFK